MADDESSPLLSTAAAKGKDREPNLRESGETSSLLAGSSDTPRYDGEQDEPSVEPNSEASTQPAKPKKPRRWASFLAMAILGLLVIAIIILAFVLPDAVQEYAKQAAVVEPTKLSLESITTNGVQARVQANFWLDGSKVSNHQVRRLGRATMWIANKLETEQSTLAVYLPDYGNILLGTAGVPPVVINLREGDITKLDFVTELSPGNVEGIRTITNEWMEGRLDKLRLEGKADLALKSGIVSLGTHTVAESITIEANKIPTVPQYNMTRLTVKDVPAPGNRKSMVADVSLTVYNDYPVQLNIPELGFEILVPGCKPDDPFIIVADAVTSEVNVQPRSDVPVEVHGLIRDLPDDLTRDCPESHSSPLDALLGQYMHGQPATVYVRGSSQPDGSTPKWIADILASVTLPVPFPGRTLDGLIREFSLTDVDFSLPDPFAEPDDPAANPRVSGNVLVTAGLPSEMNFGINVTKVRAMTDVFYQSKKLGELNLDEWQPANSTRVEAKDGQEPTLKIQSRINNAPLNVTDGDVFSEVAQALLFGSKTVLLDIKARVDVKVETALGKLIIKDVPADGKVPVKPLRNGNDSGDDSLTRHLSPKVREIRVLDTTSTSMTFQALVNITNPTPYTAHVPFANVHVLKNGSIIGDVTVQNVDITRGRNTDILVTAKWQPSKFDEQARQIGRDLISQYLSGFNTTITVKTHRDSIPNQPIICEALSRFNITLAAPKLHLPSKDPEDSSRFIRDATFHVFSSTATFMLFSPLEHNTLYLDYINATAFYNHTERVGRIVHDMPFAAPPGQSRTPRLPVQWTLDSVGYDAVRNALGGRLKLDAHADVDLRLGNWKERVWYIGKGIGARIQV